mgnify:CR=1 FL=1
MDRPVLITAGATRNPIDSMRAITANSSGATGIHISQRLQQNGRTCTVMGSNLALLQPNCSPHRIEFTSTRDLLAKMKLKNLRLALLRKTQFFLTNLKKNLARRLYWKVVYFI